MNVLEAITIESPFGKTETCAQFTVDDTSSFFLLHDITAIGQEYTLSFWVKANSAGRLSVADATKEVTSEWQKHIITFTATSETVSFLFQIIGTYYIYHPKHELGNKATDWSPAPEDMASASDVAGITDEIAAVAESVSSLDIKADNISASVKEIETKTNDALDSVNGSIETLTQEVSAKMTSEAVEIQIKSALENGTSKVTTETGFTFDADGLTVEKSGSEMKTMITEDGMKIYQNEDEVLTANNQGVDARNLHATTYLIVGGRSRFENFGDNRTGCFWIGG